MMGKQLLYGLSVGETAIIFLFNMVHIYDFCELQRNSSYNFKGS